MEVAAVWPTCTGWVRLAGVTVWFTIAPAGPWAPENTCKSLDAKIRHNKIITKESSSRSVQCPVFMHHLHGKWCLTCSRGFDKHWHRFQHRGQLSRCTSAGCWCDHSFINRHILLRTELTGGLSLRLRLSRLLGLQQDILLDLETQQDSVFTCSTPDESIWSISDEFWVTLTGSLQIESPNEGLSQLLHNWWTGMSHYHHYIVIFHCLRSE